jgi:hypothetical protein
MKMVAVVCALLALSAPLFAAGEFDAWKRESQQQYRGYRDAQDRQFGQYLDQQWREFRVFRGERRDPAPKPVAPPAVKPASTPVTPSPAPAPKPQPPAPAPVTPTPAPAPAPKTQPPALVPLPVPAPGVTISSFGMEFRLPPLAIPPLEGPVDGPAISRWWKQAGEADDGKAVTAVRELRETQNLSDWSLHLLLAQYAAADGAGWNGRVAREWYLLTRLGYLARLAVSDGRLVLLLRTDRVLYETRYLEIAGARYYLVATPPEGGDRFTTYEGDHPSATRSVSMAQDFSVFGGRTPDRHRKLTFAWRERSYTLDVSYNGALVDYLYAVPPTELSVYFNTPESAPLHRQLEDQLRPLLAGLSQEEAVNLLLAFVQKAFAYEVDNEQFGREHYMFADETVHYPYSDCEDRAVIFARLVRELVGLPVVGVSYPGHVATAVALPQVKGRTIRHGNTTYVIADPTYIGASAGMAMPQFAGVEPDVVEIR